MAIDREKGLADYFANLTLGIAQNPISDKVRCTVRQHLLDAIGCAYIGCRFPVYRDLSALCPDATTGSRLPGNNMANTSAAHTAMLWAYAVNASVFEDGSREGACHPSAAVIPAVIALSHHKDWGRIDSAIIAGYDVMVRIARSGNPAFTQRGFHPTSITAPFGAAAAACVLLSLDSLKTQNALCLAALGCSGLMSAFKSGQTQPLQVAWAVRNGVMAAMMAEAGHSGYPFIMEEGFFHAYLGRSPALSIDHPLEHEFAIQGSYLKPYPGCRHLHPSIDAFALVLKENEINHEQISKIHIGTYQTAIDTEIHTLKTRGDAYFNIPYALAAAAILGKNDWDSFDEKHFKNRMIKALMEKVAVCVNPDIDKQYPHQRGATAKVETDEGNAFSACVTHPLGEPENPLPASITIEKFRNAAKLFLTKENMETIERLLVPNPADEPETIFRSIR